MKKQSKIPKTYRLDELQPVKYRNDKGAVLMADYVIGDGLWKNKRFLKNLIIEKDDTNIN